MTKIKSSCVYILKCSDGTLYTGWTNNFHKRIASHNNGTGAKYTRGRTPVTPVYLEYLDDDSSARKREVQIKKLPLKKKQLLIESSLNSLGKL